MKKVFFVFCAVLLVASLTVSAGAAGIEKWLTFYHEDRQTMPMLAESPEGLIVNIANYTHKPDEDSDETFRFGIVYNEKIKLDGFKIEFDVRRSPVGGDAWIAVNFFDNPRPMHHDDPTDTAGFISLIRPANEEELGFEGYQSTIDNTFSGTGRLAVEVDDVTNCSIVLEIKRQADGYYFYMNGEEHPGAHEDLLALFADDMAYLEITTYCSGEEDHAYELLIKSINGQPVVWEEAAPEPEPEPEAAPEAPAEPAPAPEAQPVAPPPASAPETGDAGMAIFAALISAAAVLLKKKIAVK